VLQLTKTSWNNVRKAEFYYLRLGFRAKYKTRLKNEILWERMDLTLSAVINVKKMERCGNEKGIIATKCHHKRQSDE
jgi:hypothetical protein